MIASAWSRSILDRMLGAALLETETYQEAAQVPSVGTQAALVVIISSIAAGLGSLNAGLLGLVIGSVTALVGWGVYAFVTYRLATTRYGAPRTFTILSATGRTLALASSPRVFLVFAFVPGIGLLLGLAVHAWVLITTVPAVRASLDLDVPPAIAVAVAGSLPMLALWALVAVLI